MKKHHVAVQCDRCGSDNTERAALGNDIRRCNTCGNYFEDETAPVMAKARRSRLDDE